MRTEGKRTALHNARMSVRSCFIRHSARAPTAFHLGTVSSREGRPLIVSAMFSGIRIYMSNLSNGNRNDCIRKIVTGLFFESCYLFLPKIEEIKEIKKEQEAC